MYYKRNQVYGETIPFQASPSRRSVVHSTKGIVSCTQPLAAAAGVRVLQLGGNAADAAVAVAAALNVTEPCQTGIGGDCFCLFYSSKDKSVRALNGSGRSVAGLTIEQLRKEAGLPDGPSAEIPYRSAYAATVPGAAAGWCDTVEKFGSGKLSMEQILTPAIELAEEGYPVSEIAAYHWHKSEELLQTASPNGGEMLKSDTAAKGGLRAPRAGELFSNPTMAQTFRTLAKEGKEGFYSGRIAEEIVSVLRARGGHMTLDDLKEHAKLGSQEVDAISLTFTGQGLSKEDAVRVWEHPPNGQGIVALIALGILEELERNDKIPTFKVKDHNSPEYLHAMIEALRIAFSDGSWWIADPDVAKVPSQGLLKREYLAERAKMFDPHKASPPLKHGSPAHRSSDTVYFSVTDNEGNGCSFIMSNYAGFGTAIVPKGCGFTLQNRGANFVLDEASPNCYAPRKRPYHTIIPALTTNAVDNSLHSVFGVMGGFMQPQGHVQVLLNQVIFGMSPQAALDAPRFCIGASGSEPGGDERDVYLEEGIPVETVEGLAAKGHSVVVRRGYDRWVFGRGQIIRCVEQDGRRVYSAGSDLRGDGMAVPA